MTFNRYLTSRIGEFSLSPMNNLSFLQNRKNARYQTNNGHSCRHSGEGRLLLHDFLDRDAAGKCAGGGLGQAHQRHHDAAGSVLATDILLLAAASLIGEIPGIILIVSMKKHLACGFSMERVV